MINKVMNKIKVTPNVFAYADKNYKNLLMEITIPGVKEQDIHMKIKEDGFSLSAPRDDEFEYVIDSSFCYPVTPYKTKTNFKDGLLKVEVPFKNPIKYNPWEH
ncbi:MAG: Hsp20/alpha crystallin family protein [bacterium]